MKVKGTGKRMPNSPATEPDFYNERIYPRNNSLVIHPDEEESEEDVNIAASPSTQSQNYAHYNTLDSQYQQLYSPEHFQQINAFCQNSNHISAHGSRSWDRPKGISPPSQYLSYFISNELNQSRSSISNLLQGVNNDDKNKNSNIKNTSAILRCPDQSEEAVLHRHNNAQESNSQFFEDDTLRRLLVSRQLETANSTLLPTDYRYQSNILSLSRQQQQQLQRNRQDNNSSTNFLSQMGSRHSLIRSLMSPEDLVQSRQISSFEKYLSDRIDSNNLTDLPLNQTGSNINDYRIGNTNNALIRSLLNRTGDISTRISEELLSSNRYMDNIILGGTMNPSTMTRTNQALDNLIHNCWPTNSVFNSLQQQIRDNQNEILPVNVVDNVARLLRTDSSHTSLLSKLQHAEEEQKRLLLRLLDNTYTNNNSSNDASAARATTPKNRNNDKNPFKKER
jgi:hypothetical protein